MYKNKEKQNRQGARHSRENGNPVGWIPVPVFTGINFPYAGMTANTNLKIISNDQLLFQTKTLVQKERQINIQVLQHLQEIECRKALFEKQEKQIKNKAIKQQATITKILLDKNKKTQSNQRLIDDAPIIHNEESLQHQVYRNNE